MRKIEIEVCPCCLSKDIEDFNGQVVCWACDTCFPGAVVIEKEKK
jgi:hypothetical protein